MQKRALLALLMAMLLTLTSCGTLIVKDEERDNAREVIRIDKLGVVYTKADVTPYVLNQLINGQYQYGTDYTYEQACEDVTNALVEREVFDARLKEYGLDTLTAEEQAQVDENAAMMLEYYGPDSGYTLESLREEMTLYLQEEKLKAHVTTEVTLTEDELLSGLYELAMMDKEAFEADPPAYGEAIMNQQAVYYCPAGYRNVQQILIAFHAEDDALITDINEAIDQAITEENAAATELAAAKITNVDDLAALVTVDIPQPEAPTAQAENVTVTAALPDDLSEEATIQVERLAKARALQAFYDQQLEAAAQQAYARIDAEADEVLAELAAGGNWAMLVSAHNDDPGMNSSFLKDVGYPICAGFDTFDPAFVDAAMALENVGDVSGKIPGGYGYYILRYTSDAPEGIVSLDSVRQDVTDQLLPGKQTTAYAECMERWVLSAGAVIDLEPLER